MATLKEIEDKYYQHCNVVMLPIQSKAVRLGQLVIGPGNNLFSSRQSNDIGTLTAYELYITSDEEIKEGDWFICNQAAQQCVEVRKDSDYTYKIINKFNGEIQYHSKHWKDKIIATTDTSLRRMGDDGIVDIALGLEISYIPESFIKYFIEEYNKGNVITDVLVEYEKILNPQWESYFEYTNYCMINGYSNQWYDKEILKVNYKDNNITIKKVKDSWNRKEHSKSLSDLGRDLSRTFNLPFKDSLEFTMKWIEENL